MMDNPIHGAIRGEVILNGDASGGVKIVLYAVTPGWDTIAVDSGITAIGDGPGATPTPYVMTTGGAPFISAMIGKTITFVNQGSFTIVDVIASNTIKLTTLITLEVNEAFTIEGQESLRVVELDDNDILAITDVFISQEKDSKYSVVIGEDVPGKRIVCGRLLEMGSVNVQFQTPFICSAGNGILKYFGHDIGLNVCLLKGSIT